MVSASTEKTINEMNKQPLETSCTEYFTEYERTN